MGSRAMVSKELPVAVVQFPLLLIPKDVVGRLNFLKLLFGRLVVGIEVRMILPRKISIGFLDLVLEGVSLNSSTL